MDESIASGVGRGKNKRYWSAEEDKALVVALSDLATDPHWKCENGFRSGYMQRLEDVINKAIPGCGLKALPHIDSRLKTLATKFRAFVQMLGTSGFKWDDEKHTISVERSVYDEYCKVHTNCKNLYGYVFPHFNALAEIYGKDYATRKHVEGFVDAIGNMEKSTPTPITFDSSDDEDTIASGTVDSAPPLKKVKRESTSKRKEGKKECGSNSELASLQAFMKDTNVHLSTMASVMKRAEEREQRADEREQRADEREQQVIEKSEKVLEELLSLKDITTQQALEVAQILTAQSNKLMIFFKCPDDLKGIFVKSLLGVKDANA